MKLITIYDVLKDQSFLVEAVRGEETLDALRAAVQQQVGFPSGRPRLAFGNHVLKSGRLPSKCLQSPFRYIDMVPYETRISRSFKVYIKVNGNPKPIKIKRLYYSTTLGELKIKLSKNSPQTSRTMELRKDGQRLLKDHCFLMYYGIANDTTLDAFEVNPQHPEAHRENLTPLFLQLSTGKAQRRLIKGTETVRELKEVIVRWTGIPFVEQKLYFHGSMLQDDMALLDLKQKEHCTIHVLRTNGKHTPEFDWHPIMGFWELDHFGHLLNKVGKVFHDGDEPHTELVQYLFVRWKNHMMSSGDNIHNDIRKHRLNTNAAWVFFEVRPEIMQNAPRSSSHRTKFLAFLWVTEEILKLVPRNPPWEKAAGHLHLRDLKWTDEARLQAETAKNERLILHHSRLVLTGRADPAPQTEALPNGRMRHRPPSMSRKKSPFRFSVFKPPPSNLKLGERIRSGAKRASSTFKSLYFIRGRIVRVGSSIRMFKRE